MKCWLIMLIIILVPTLYCHAESVDGSIKPIPTLEGKKGTNNRELLKQSEKQVNQATQEKLIIRIPEKEEIPKPLEEAKHGEETKSIEATQTQSKEEKNNREEPKVDSPPPSDDEKPSPEIPKDSLPQDKKGEQKENTEETVITPTRTEQPLKNTGSSVSVITRKDIENRKAPLLLDVLRQVPGLEVTRTQGIGGTTSLFIRGASAAQTLVFVDGVQMNSPTSGAFNFANLTTDNIERVEILRGPQSTLYGSEAIGGVVNIITKKGTGDNKVILGTEYGMHDTYRETVNVSGGKERFDY
ncbi:MAG: hypothetical protein FJ264_17065, partial [Planctomycetes bacterium]|nr:hypothetical protein [Planctomycetota bacterium]